METLVVAAIVAAAAVSIALRLRRSWKGGKDSCGCGKKECGAAREISKRPSAP